MRKIRGPSDGEATGPPVWDGSEAQVQAELLGARKVLSRGMSKRAAREIAVGLGKVDPVKQVEYVGAELKLETLQGEFLGELCIHTGHSRADISVPATVALAAQGRRR